MRVIAMGLAAGFALAAVASRPEAQPSPGGPTAPAPDFARAKALYESATTAMANGRYADAARDFGGAYDITKDPVLFFKIGTANEKAGTCDIALVYYARYLKEAKPDAKYVAVTKERVEACHGDWAVVSGGDGSGAAGSGATGSGSGGSDAGSGTGSDTALLGSNAVGSGASSATEKPSHGKDPPWLMVGGALAFVTAGVVLAYSASSSEQDIKDLYAGLGNGTPVFDSKNAQRYQDLVDEGHRYQYLSWGAFGLAAGFGAVAAVLFVREHNAHLRDEREHVQITPIASPTGAGVSATLHF